jgi:hypothetical protein
MWVGALNQVDLSGADVMLNGFLALNRLAHVGKLFVPDEQIDAILSREG